MAHEQEEMLCPRCHGKLNKIVSYKREWDMRAYRIFTFMCPACSFKNEHKVEISDRELRDSQEHPRFDEG